MDEENEYVHKVGRKILELYKLDPTLSVKAFCGKVWKPELPIRVDKPNCPQCFRAETPYALGA